MATATETKYPAMVMFDFACGHSHELEAISQADEARIRDQVKHELCANCLGHCPCCGEDSGGDTVMYTIAETAVLLGISEQAVRTMIADGELRAYVLGATVGVHRYDIKRVHREVRNRVAA